MHHGPWNETEIWWVCTFMITEIPQTVASPVKHTSNHGQHLYLQFLPFFAQELHMPTAEESDHCGSGSDLITLQWIQHYSVTHGWYFGLAPVSLWSNCLSACFKKQAKDAKSIFSPVQELAKSMFYIIRNLSPSGHIYFNYHQLCKIHNFLQHQVLQGAQWDQALQWTQSLPAEYFRSLLSPVVDRVCTQGSWQGWRERQSPHNLHLSSFIQEMAPFILINATYRLINLQTTVGSRIWLPGERSDTFFIALEVQMEYRI